MIEAVEHHIGHRAGTSVIHVVREVIEMEEICKEIVAETKLRIRRIGVAHSGQRASLESMVFVPCAASKVITFEQPPLGLAGNPSLVAIAAKREVAVRHKVREDKLSGLGVHIRRRAGNDGGRHIQSHGRWVRGWETNDERSLSLKKPTEDSSGFISSG